jgi:threonine aldolase
VIELRSDNAAGVATEILAAVNAANTGSAMAYGADDWSERLHQRAREVFEHDDVTVFPVSTGTAANALGLSAICPPWGLVFCHETAHVLRTECGATSMFSGGGAVRGLGGMGSLLTVESLEHGFATTRWGDNHHSQPSALSLTSPTDMGEIYTEPQIAALSDVAKGKGLRVHLDGARVANAIAALGCTPADYTWRAGVDVLSLGATKNGALSTDAIVCFNQAAADELFYRTKRAGQVSSKMRFQSAQLDAYLTDGLWLRLAATANAAMATIATGLHKLGLELLHEPHANMAFVRVDDATADALESHGLAFYRMGGGVIRLVTSFQTTSAQANEILKRFELVTG